MGDISIKAGEFYNAVFEMESKNQKLSTSEVTPDNVDQIRAQVYSQYLENISMLCSVMKTYQEIMHKDLTEIKQAGQKLVTLDQETSDSFSQEK